MQPWAGIQVASSFRDDDIAGKHLDLTYPPEPTGPPGVGISGTYTTHLPVQQQPFYSLMAEIQAERTPNPDSLKFTALDGGFFHDDVVAISSKDEADRHPLARKLFSLAGVDDVFITPDFVTVSKDPTTDWDDLQSDVESTLSSYLQSD